MHSKLLGQLALRQITVLTKITNTLIMLHNRQNLLLCISLKLYHKRCISIAKLHNLLYYNKYRTTFVVFFEHNSNYVSVKNLIQEDKYMKRIISLILVISLTLLTLTACSEGSSESSSSESESESYPLTVEAARKKAILEAYDEIEKSTIHVLKDTKEIIQGSAENINIANAYCEQANRMQHNDGKEFICYEIRITGHYTCEDIYGYSHVITIDHTRKVNDDGSKYDYTEKTIEYDIKYQNLAKK